MAGGCCCSVKRKDSAIIGFAGMNIAVFTILMLICSKEIDAECRRRTALGESVGEFIEYYRKEHYKNRRKPYYDPQDPYINPKDPYNNHEPIFANFNYNFHNGCGELNGFFGACVFLCVIGIIIGILLIFAVSKKSKCLFWIWIIFQSLIVLILTVMGYVILHNTYSYRHGITFGNISYSALFLLSPFPFFIWSLISVCMSMKGIVTGTAGDEQQGQVYRPGDNQPSNQQMQPQIGGYPAQPQNGNNTIWPQLYQMPAQPGGPPQPLPPAPPV